MEYKNNLENVLKDLNQFINIDASRSSYTAHFNTLRSTILTELRNNNIFKYLCKGFQLVGSYGDNLKVRLPNEFDLLLIIKFPEQSMIIVKEDPSLPGNVYLDFSKVLRKIANEKQHEQNLVQFKKWLNDQNFLYVEKFQSFIQSCFTNALLKMKHELLVNEKLATLRYTRQGPAHTIHVTGDCNMEYSVDFVPAILLNSKQNIFHKDSDNWEAIPKPSKTYDPNYISFRASFFNAEHRILSNKFQFKNALRIMKKFRDSHMNMMKMKSYFIKTLFLWKADQENDQYWRKPLANIIIDMFKAMENSLRNEKLPFFWDERLNLYDCYNSKLLHEMLSCVENSRDSLEKAAHQLTLPLQRRIHRIFLSSSERVVLEAHPTLGSTEANSEKTTEIHEKKSCTII